MQSKGYLVSAIKTIIRAEGIIEQDQLISTLSTDSRRITNAQSALFFALNGRRSGNEFVAEAYAAGIRNFVVTMDTGINLPGANFLLVDDVLAACG